MGSIEYIVYNIVFKRIFKSTDGSRKKQIVKRSASWSVKKNLPCKFPFWSLWVSKHFDIYLIFEK